MRSPLGAVIAVASIGCASLDRAELDRVRIYPGAKLERAITAVLESLPDAGVVALEATPEPERRGATVRGVAAVGAPRPVALLLEVSVVRLADAVEVKVSAEPAEQARSNLPLGANPNLGEARPCPCQDALVPEGNRPTDNLRNLAEARRLVRTYLAALDRRLR